MIELPFPPATLSGHNTGHWGGKSPTIAKFRQWANDATLAVRPVVPADGDIRVSVTFYAPDNRGDRVNYPNRMKPIWDGIADALKVNDRRFLPTYHYAENARPGKIVVVIG
jgi:crossover junction endodeoxyribonuclease RusA